MFLETDFKCWNKWHDHWVQKAKKLEIPIYFFRFEDLLLNPEAILSEMFQFILGVESVEDLVIGKRIKDVI